MDRSAIYTESGLYLYTEEKARLGTGGEMLPRPKYLTTASVV